MNLPHEVEAVKRLLRGVEIRDCLAEVRDILDEAYNPKSTRTEFAVAICDALDTIEAMVGDEEFELNSISEGRKILEISELLTDGSLEVRPCLSLRGTAVTSFLPREPSDGL